MNRKNSIVAKILLILFAFNCFSLYLYFSHHNNNINHNHHHLAGYRRLPFPVNHHAPPQHHLLKPWPTLPSYLPWSQQNPDVKIGSCEAYFGNGFTRRLDILPLSRRSSGGGGGGWFRCVYSETLRSSICEGGRLRMWPERIKMSKGGERIEDVFGRREEDELPVFEDGAFEVDGNGELGFWRKNKRLVGEEFLQYVTDGSVSKHAMRELIRSIQVVGGGSRKFECDQWVEEPTVLVTRYEYANLFHTITDWYSAYVASRVTGLPHRPHLLFVDGHCKTPLEETWRALFSSVRHAKNFTGSVCFRHAILSPLGYDTPLFKGLTEGIDCKGTSAQDLWQNPDNYKTARLSEFGEMIKAAYGFSVNRPHIRKPASGHNVLFVRREDYLAHPRHKGRVESRLSNEEEVFNSVNNWASNYMQCKINLVNGLFAHMSMKEQLQAIQDASIIIGAHGAGLTHIVSAMPNKTVILEIVSSQFRRPHFELIAQWKGLEYKAIYLSGSHAHPPDVINKLNGIVENLGC